MTPKLLLPKVDHAAFKRRCLADIEDFYAEGEVRESREGVHIFKDNGAELLAVAHLDTVCDYDHYYREKVGGRQAVFNAQLDDRLGAYLLLDYLPQLGVKYDVLLTENEELCSSTAQDFVTDKQYKWMFQFDRAGTDVVLYQYESDTVEDLLKGVGWRIGIGSYSDICDLGHLKTCGINFGCGYELNHTRASHVYLSDIYDNVRKFLRFWQKYQHKTLPVPKNTEHRWARYVYDPVDVWDRGRMTAGDDIANYDRCSECNRLYPIDKMYWFGTDGYCQTCLDETRVRRTGRTARLVEYCSGCGHADHIGWCPDKTCQCFVEANIWDTECAQCLAPHEPGSLLCNECGYEFIKED